jgi:hypothetical protein
MKLFCPLCGLRPKRDDRGEDVDGNIQVAYRAALKCDCGLRLEKTLPPVIGADAALEADWRRMMAAALLLRDAHAV